MGELLDKITLFCFWLWLAAMAVGLCFYMGAKFLDILKKHNGSEVDDATYNGHYDCGDKD